MEEIKYRSKEEMKDSGVEWLGKIPKDWGVKRLKNYFKFEKGKNASLYTYDYIRLNEGHYPVYSGQTENDGIMGRINTYDYDLEKCIFTTTVGAKVMSPLILSGKFNLSQNCLIMIGNNIFEQYVYYLLFPMFRYEKSLIPSYMQPSLRIDDLRKFSILYPIKKEQKKIANFLDIKTSQFDSIISKKEKLIEKLEEAKKSLISEVVTGKVKIVNGEMIERKPEEMKDSGVEWLGKIPKDWEVKKIGFIFSFKNGVNADSSKYGKGIKFINVKEVIDNETLNYEQIPNKVTISKSSIVENEVKKGDILLNRTSETIEELGLSTVYMDYRKVVFGGFVIRGREKSNELTQGFKKYFLKSYEVRKQIMLCSSGSIRKNIAQNALKNVYIAFPNYEKQEEISKILDEKTTFINTIIIKNKKQIEKLKEAKQSLISEAVTGKIDLRDWEIKEKETLK